MTEQVELMRIEVVQGDITQQPDLFTGAGRLPNRFVIHAAAMGFRWARRC